MGNRFEELGALLFIVYPSIKFKCKIHPKPFLLRRKGIRYLYGILSSLPNS